ncbi:pyridoxal phosphate-dependent aminotransferase [Hyalangium versicolor]|uniref:pyridoxal phosphate-dependent aminotransferase n=1 Tax=Hyalangium versicolor TaxID=2861190 RepID=UPI001CC8EF40|nr:pyridoxal phosphate-dependent aminotransferase [Hyalangium versicolor]
MFALDEAARRHSEAGRDVILLTLGKSDLPLHPEIVAAITRAVSDPDRSSLVFPGGLPELREALSARYSALAGQTISPSRILIDAGTSSLYPNLLRILGAAGHEVVIPKPYYPLYRVAASLVGASVAYYNIDLRTMSIDVDSVRDAITTATRVLVVNSPGNPLGNVVPQDDMVAILRLLPADAFILFDEIYENALFSNESPLAPMLLHGSASASSRVVITNSFSKGYRMYTKRVGWCVLPQSQSEAMLSVLQHTRLTVDPSVQYGAVEALRREDEVRSLRTIHEARWKHAVAAFSPLSSVRLLPSAGGFYCTLDCTEFARFNGLASDSALALDILYRTGVATVPGEDFGLPGMLRLSFTSSRFEEAVDRLRDYFGGNATGAIDGHIGARKGAVP